jgi:hypothetical protein
MSRKRKDEDLYDMEEDVEESNILERVMSVLEDSGIDYSVKKVANGKSIILENEIVFRFNHDNELTAIDK